MIVRKFSEAKAYEAPNHRDYKSYSRARKSLPARATRTAVAASGSACTPGPAIDSTARSMPAPCRYSISAAARRSGEQCHPLAPGSSDRRR